jgi:hypothetical protein
MTNPLPLRSDSARWRLPQAFTAALAAWLAATGLPAQTFSATGSGQLSAMALGSPQQSYGGPITATTTTVQAFGTIGISSASATLQPAQLTVSANSAASAMASATVLVTLQGPVGAGVRVQVFGGSTGTVPGTASVSVQGQPQLSGATVDYQLPAGGLVISVSASVPFSGFFSSMVNLTVSWSYPGVTTVGAPTPGCLGPSVAWTQGVPKRGNAGFGITGTNAQPQIGAVLGLGLGGLTTPFPFGSVQVWLDPSAPIDPIYVPSNPAGELLHALPIPNQPTLVGLQLFAQWIVFEPPGCMPLDVSGSNAIRVTVLP